MVKLIIHTDGSHIKQDAKKVTYGIVLEHDKTIVTASDRLNTEKFLKDYKAKVSNPTAELYACVKALRMLRDVRNAELHFYSDYTGVAKWLQGEWKINKPYIQDLVIFGQKMMEKILENGCIINFHWVKGHSGNALNEYADQVCKLPAHDQISPYIEKAFLKEYQTTTQL